MPDAVATRLPRVLLVGRTRYELPFAGADARKFAALDEVMNWHLLARARRSQTDDRVTLLRRTPLDGILFHVRLPFTIARAARRRRPHVIVAQDPILGAAALVARRLARSDAAVVVEVHGDWRTATRLYGSRQRRLLARPSDAVACEALRRADAVRTISGFTAALVHDVGGTVDSQFPTFLDLEPFSRTPIRPLPRDPIALFVGALERYKNVDGLLLAWPEVCSRVPGARLRIVGNGRLASQVLRAVRTDRSIEYTPRLNREQLAATLDAATCLVLPSRSEGLGRVVVEALTRGRPVVATSVGALREVVVDGQTGLLVDIRDPRSLEEALVSVLGDPELAARLGANAAPAALALAVTPSEWAHSLEQLVETAQRKRNGALTNLNARRTWLSHFPR